MCYEFFIIMLPSEKLINTAVKDEVISNSDFPALSQSVNSKNINYFSSVLSKNARSAASYSDKVKGVKTNATFMLSSDNTVLAASEKTNIKKKTPTELCKSKLSNKTENCMRLHSNPLEYSNASNSCTSLQSCYSQEQKSSKLKVIVSKKQLDKVTKQCFKETDYSAMTKSTNNFGNISTAKFSETSKCKLNARNTHTFSIVNTDSPFCNKNILNKYQKHKEKSHSKVCLINNLIKESEKSFLLNDKYVAHSQKKCNKNINSASPELEICSLRTKNCNFSTLTTQNEITSKKYALDNSSYTKMANQSEQKITAQTCISKASAKNDHVSTKNIATKKSYFPEEKPKSSKNTHTVQFDLKSKSKCIKKKPNKLKRQTPFQTGKLQVLSSQLHSHIANQLSDTLIKTSNCNKHSYEDMTKDINHDLMFPSLSVPCTPGKLDACVSHNIQTYDDAEPQDDFEKTVESTIVEDKTFSERFSDGWNDNTSEVDLETGNAKVKVCPRNPICIFDFIPSVPIILPKSLDDEEHTDINPYKSKYCQASVAANVLDSMAPVKRGKERERPKKKHKSVMKKIILREKSERKQAKQFQKFLSREKAERNETRKVQKFFPVSSVCGKSDGIDDCITIDSKAFQISKPIFLSALDLQNKLKICEGFWNNNLHTNGIMTEDYNDSNGLISYSQNRKELINSFNEGKSSPSEYKCKEYEMLPYNEDVRTDVQALKYSVMNQTSGILMGFVDNLINNCTTEALDTIRIKYCSSHLEKLQSSRHLSNKAEILPFPKIVSQDHNFTASESTASIFNIEANLMFDVSEYVVESFCDSYEKKQNNDMFVSNSFATKKESDISTLSEKDILFSNFEYIQDNIESVNENQNTHPFPKNESSIGASIGLQITPNNNVPCISSSNLQKENISFILPDDRSEDIITKAIQIVLHTKKFRKYCNHLLSSELDDSVLTLLNDLYRFQDRIYHKDYDKARIKRRLVYGIKEVTKSLKLKKIKGVIIAPDLEDIVTKGGLNDALTVLIHLCSEFCIPCAFAADRKRLGQICSKPVPVSCIGISNYEGSEEKFKRMVACVDESSRDYKEIFKIIRETINKGDVNDLLQTVKEAPQMIFNIRKKIFYTAEELLKDEKKNSDIFIKLKSKYIMKL